VVDIFLQFLSSYPILAIAIAFILGLLSDVVWAKWAVSIKKDQPCIAANFSVLIYIFGMMYTLFIIDKNLGLVVSYVLGGWLGTYLTVKFSR